jgi:hypothetical protein
LKLVDSVKEAEAQPPMDDNKADSRKTPASVVRTARKDEHVIAKAGERVIAERSSKVVANEGSYVIALEGSKVIAAPGSEVVMQEGSVVINPYGHDETLTKIIAMEAAEGAKKPSSKQQSRHPATSSTVLLNQVSTAYTVSLNNAKGPVTKQTSDNSIFARYSTLEDQLSSLNLVYHSFAANKSRSYSEWQFKIDRRKFVGKDAYQLREP